MRNPILILLLSLAFAGGCANTSPTHAQKSPVWPSPPERARIAFVQAISTPADIDAGRGVFSRLAGFILGAKIEEIIRPYGVAVDSKGRLLVADSAFKKVHVFDIKNSEYSAIEDASDADLALPVAIAVDADDNIYVTDSILNKVFAFNKKKKFLFKIDGFKKPTGVAVNKKTGLLYVADTGANAIKVFDLSGKPVKTIGGPGTGKAEFNLPVDIFVSAGGDIYVTDTMNYRIQIFDKNGGFMRMFGRHGDGTGDLGRPKGVAVDIFGNIYVVDAIFDTVQIFDRDGKFLLNFGGIGNSAGNFWMPTGIYIDETNRIYVADSYNKRVQVFEYIGGK
ncbi:MAG: 6-bladed beta-propeller [Deltaproteobacteria bacterium]|nr:6-bladed beta-propeller [Deltaproteobacteria bacterium]